MKKSFTLLALLLALTTLAGCGSASGASQATADYAADTAAVTEETAAESESLSAGLTAQPDPSEKIIYTGYAELETTDFDASVAAVYDLVEQYDGFLESSSVSGRDLSDTVSRRYGNFTLRIPQERYGDVTTALEAVGNVTYLSSNAENITAQYTDTQAQLDAYALQEERLLDIMAQADTVEDLIALESRLSEVRYEKDSLTTQLKNWDTQVSYSTLTVSLSEVQTLTPQDDRSYWQQVGDGFVSTLRWMGQTAKTLFRLLVSALPILVPAAAIIAACVLLFRRRRKKRKAIAAEADAPSGD
jgi:hypothetical protein